MTEKYPDPLEAPPDAEIMITALVDDLVAALINTRIYWSDHPRVANSVRSVLRQLRVLCDENNTESITVAVTTDFLVFENRPLLGATMGASRLIKTLKNWDSGGVRLSRDATQEDLERLLELLNSQCGENQDYEHVNAEIARQGPQRITLLPKYRKTGSDPFAARDETGRARCAIPMQMYQSVLDLLQGITVSVASGGLIDFAPVMQHAEEMLRRLRNHEGPMINLARQDQYDAFTFGHSMRVSVLALNFGRAITDDEDTLIRLGTAALLHDVGKAMVPFEVLHSNKPLTDDERREISRHPEYGAQILIDHQNPDPHAISATFGHHCAHGERGYPRTLHEHKVSLVTDIVGIVDVYEALTAARPYKRAMSPIRAYRIMMGMTDKFDMGLLRRFIEVTGVFPCGQLVELSDGSRARVEAQSRDLRRPVVRMLTAPDGSPLDATAATGRELVLDLDEQDGSRALSIARMVREDVSTLVST